MKPDDKKEGDGSFRPSHTGATHESIAADLAGVPLPVRVMVDSSMMDEKTPVSPVHTASLLTTAPVLSFDGLPAIEADVQEAMLRLHAAVLLEDLYDARVRLSLARTALFGEREKERLRLEKKAEIFLRSVTSAQALSNAAQSATSADDSCDTRKIETLQTAGKPDPYEAFLNSAKAELEETRARLDVQVIQEKAFFEAEMSRVSDAIVERVCSLLDQYAPLVVFSIQPVGPASAVAWMERPTGDEAVLLYFLLTGGHLPTHYDALFDDAFDDMTLEPPTFFEEEGYPARPVSLEEAESLGHPEARVFVPFKAMLPFQVPGLDFPRLRFVNQGPVLQLVAREASGSYAPLMSLETAEAVAGMFIQLQIEKRIELKLMAM